MKCPYCDNEMQRGELCGDSRSRVSWIPENPYNKTYMDKVFSADIHRVKNVTYRAMFWIPADYCKQCGKMIIETDIT